MKGRKPVMTEIRLQIQSPHWRDEAACANTDPEIFFPIHGNKDQERTAKRICAHCPVAAKCLLEALAAGHEYGVWGGLSEAERAKIKRQGPLKYELACYWCKRIFIGSSQRKFCCKDCWQEHIRHNSRNRKLAD